MRFSEHCKSACSTFIGWFIWLGEMSAIYSGKLSSWSQILYGYNISFKHQKPYQVQAKLL